jgi:predicted 2-oxoglutarate/Fe(II)-dependent dioxygenase YbiX
VSLAIGDRVPGIFGATADGRVYSLDVQAGRPTLVIALGSVDADGARPLLARIAQALPQVQAAGGDIAPLAPIGAFARAPDLQIGSPIIYVADASGLESASLADQPAAIVLDRAARILDIQPVGPEVDLAALYGAALAPIARETPRICVSAAPVLIVPNLATPAFCRAVIDHFEASPHSAGVMASYVGGEAQARIDLDKKHRRDIELSAGEPLHEAIMALFAGRIAPEIKRAFQKDITFADRILIARYDDDGGYFKRHRDNAAPQTAFRQFAVSLNLNTHEYEGGELMFPEYNDHLYNPPAGGAAVFSASLLHEARPVTRGRRYVVLSFLCGADAPVQA